jgi:formylglycine-generating enzyme required for sulfatase activity
MRRLLLLSLGLLTAGFDAGTGRGVVLQRPLEATVHFPAGRFVMGTDDTRAYDALCLEEMPNPRMCSHKVTNEKPAREVFISAFQLDRVEVTVRAWRSCVQAGACSPQPLEQPDARFLEPELPITAVTWQEATQYCHWRGGRLPTEAEWERAARGRDGRTWPWGNLPRPTASNHGRVMALNELSPSPYPVFQPDPSDGFAFLAPVGSYPQGASPEGVLDLAGNAAEWTADVYQEEPPQLSSSVNPRGPAAGGYRVIRGGSWREPRILQRTTNRDAVPPDTRSPEIGFRCAREPL